MTTIVKDSYTLMLGDCLERMREIPDGSVNCAVTSPPYWGLRDYSGEKNQIGQEPTPDGFAASLVAVFREVRRILRDDGILWLNLGDTYFGSSTASSNHKNFGANMAVVGKWGLDKSAGGTNPNHKNTAWPGARKNPEAYSFLKPKDLVGIPWRVAFALQRDGWYLRSDIIWAKPNPMPDSVRDRPTRNHEYIFMLTKSQKYYFDAPAIYEDAADGKKNKRSVWTIPVRPMRGHSAAFPQDLIRPCILAGAPEGGVVLDPFFGSGTSGVVTLDCGRQFIGIEKQPSYFEIAARRLAESHAQSAGTTSDTLQTPASLDDSESSVRSVSGDL